MDNNQLFHRYLSYAGTLITKKALLRVSWSEQGGLLAGKIRSRPGLLPAYCNCSFHNDAHVRSLNGYGTVGGNVTTLRHSAFHLRGLIHV